MLKTHQEFNIKSSMLHALTMKQYKKHIIMVVVSIFLIVNWIDMVQIHMHIVVLIPIVLHQMEKEVEMNYPCTKTCAVFQTRSTINSLEEVILSAVSQQFLTIKSAMEY